MNERFRIVNALVLASAALVSVSSVRAQEGIWTDVKPVEGGINTNGSEYHPAVSGDGLTMYFASFGGGDDLDIWAAWRASPDEPFGPAGKLEGDVNTDWQEALPTVSADGLTLYFSSDRPGGLGENDIYKATRDRTDGDDGHPAPFGDVTNLGPVINTPGRDGHASVSNDHLIMVFPSNRPEGFGSADLYMATRATPFDEFGDVVNLGANVNTPLFELNPSVSGDGLVVFFGSVGAAAPAPENIRIWITRRASLEEPFGPAVALGAPINVQDANAHNPDVSREWPADGAKLYFDSTDRAGGHGATDLWEATWLAGPPPLPTASFVADPETGAAPLEVHFDASTSSTPAGTITKYEWDFGDGAVAAGKQVNHTYTSAGRYLISLWVTNDSDRMNRERKVLEVLCPSSDIAPWTFGAVGEPAFPGSARLEGGDEDRCLVLCAGGQDISGGTENFSFVHSETTGDVLLTAQVSEMASPDGRAKVGIMFRESVGIGAPFAAMFVENSGNGEGRFSFSHRDPGGGVRTRWGLSTTLPDAWIQIRRKGAEFIGLSSTDGVTWTQVNSVVLDLAAVEMLAGVVATGIDSDPSASFEPLTATVCNLEISSGPVGPPPPPDSFLDLSDIIAGGDGTGEPEDTFYVGVDLDTGEFLEFWQNGQTSEFDGINPSPVDESDFIDSVFFLNQVSMPISTDGLPFDFDPGDSFDRSWNHALANITADLLSANGVIQAGDRKDLETCVGLHAAAGITFDLHELRAEHGAEAVHTFTSYIGMDGGMDGCQDGGFMTLSVMFSNEDEILMDPTTEDGSVWKLRVPRGVGARYAAVIPPEATFLTLVSGAGGNGFGCDHGVFGNPRIHPLREPPEIRFRRGDPTSDGRTNVSDPVAILSFLFGNGSAPGCMKSADVDNTGTVNLTDPVSILNFLFAGGAAPVAPFEVCGTDAGGLSCESYPPCG